jgi:PAS domain-containing protein
MYSLQDTDSTPSGHALSASEHRFRQLADAMPYIVWSAEPTGEIDYGNQTIIQYAGLQGIDRIAEQWIELLHPDDSVPTRPIAGTWRKACRSGTTTAPSSSGTAPRWISTT